MGITRAGGGSRRAGIALAAALTLAVPAAAQAAPTLKATGLLPVTARSGFLGLEVDPLTHTVFTIGSQQIVPFTGGKAGPPLGVATGSAALSYTSAVVDPSDGTLSAVYGGGGIENDPLVSQLRQFRGGAQTADIPVGALARDIAVDPSTHTTYVLSAGTGGFIRGSKDQLDIVRGGVVVKNVPLFPVWFTPDGRPGASGIVVDSSTHTLYILDPSHRAVAVLNGDGVITGSIPIGDDPGAMAIDPATHTLYVSRPDRDVISVVRGAAEIGTIAVGDRPTTLVWDAAVKTLTVLLAGDESVSQIRDGAVVATTAAGVEQPGALAVDTADHTVYVAGTAPSEEDLSGVRPVVSILTTDERPGIVAIGPAGGLAKPDAPTYVVFDRPMDREAAGAAITFSRTADYFDTFPLPAPPTRLGASIAWLGDRVAVVIPADPLTPGTSYQVRVGTGAKDATGKALPSPVSHTFGVAQSYVERVSPGDGEGGIYPNAPVIEVFSQPVPDEARGLLEQSFSLTKRGNAAKVPGRFLWVYGRVLVFTPSQDLETGARYDVKQLRAESYFTDLDHASSFSVVDRPVVELVTPAKNATSVPKDATVVAVFSQPIDPASVGPVTFQRSFVTQEAVPVTRAWYGPRVLVLKPNAALRDNTQYVVRIPGGKDTSGRTLEGPVTWKFTTGPTFADTSAVPFGTLETPSLLGGAKAPLSTSGKALVQKLGAAGALG